MPGKSDRKSVLEALITLSRGLGDPSRDFALLGEGNTSAKIDEKRFLVKVSGAQLGQATAYSFVEMLFEPTLAMLKRGKMTDEEIKKGLIAAKADPRAKAHPSVETTLHAFLLTLPGVNFVGHTHPVSVNSFLCARDGKKIVTGHLFPEEVVFCGLSPVWVDYHDPGPPLAQAIEKGVLAHLQRYGEAPKSVLLQNHGLIAMGPTVAEVEAATLMWDKFARVVLGTMSFGGPRFLTGKQVARIVTRPDETYRVKRLRAERSNDRRT